MPRLTLATFASATVMGAQVYERAIAQHGQAALDEGGPGWDLSHTVVRSLRSPLAGDRRIPTGWVMDASARTRGLVGRAIYPRTGLVHRMKIGLPPAPGRDVITLHDIGPWVFDDEAPPVRAARDELRRARAIVTVSHFSAGEIVDRFGTRDPVVIHNGFDRERFADARPLARSRLERMGIAGDYVLAAGGAAKRKNLEQLAQAWPAVHSAHPELTLVLAGPEHPRRTALFRDVAGVALIGRVDDEVLPALMVAARALVIPSLYEGFGLPALEGMAAGVPVVALRASSLPEILGDAGILVDPGAPTLAEGIIGAVERDGAVDALVERGRQRAQRFSWERSAREHAALWRSLG